MSSPAEGREKKEAKSGRNWHMYWYRIHRSNKRVAGRQAVK
jgi:hypothetical protein